MKKLLLTAIASLGLFLNSEAATSPIKASTVTAQHIISTTAVIQNLTVTTATIQNLNAGNTFGFRNRLRNGDMRIDQRYVGAITNNFSTMTSVGAITVDRWVGAEDSEGAVRVFQSTASGPTGFFSFIRSTCTTGDFSIGAAQYAVVNQAIEGNDVRDFSFGSSDAQTVTLSFWVRSSSAGIYSVALQNNGQTRSYVAEYTINAADTWERETITVAGDTTGTWLKDSGIGIYVNFTLAAGSNYQTTAGSWSAGNFVKTANQNNWLSSSTARTWDLTGVQLELGTAATTFENRPIGVELELCQRFFWKSFDQNVVVRQNSGSRNGGISYTVVVAGTTAGYAVSVPFPVTMRVAPTVTFYSSETAAATWFNTADVGNSGTANSVHEGQRSFLARNPQVAGDGVGEVPIVHATASAEY